MRRHRLAVDLKHRFDGAGNVSCQRDLDEDQRLFRHRGMEKGEAAPVLRREPRAKIVP